ncbi:coth protein-domain-containing protein [Phycomyces nitens]|nr:coth protein-domain-containing protein [Phycomyces nitens]
MDLLGMSHPMTSYIYTQHIVLPNDIKIFPGVELELAGRSSRWFPKVSYKIELKDEKDSWLYNYQRLKLRALANDDSYLREKLAYDLINAVGLASTKFSHVRVVMNDKPLGLFGLIETFKNPWLRNEFANGDENYENGPLYQGAFLSSDSIAEKVYSDLSYYENNITKYELGQYKIKENATNGDSNFQLLMDFTKFISEAPTNTSDAVEVWQKTFDTDSFLRSMALEVLVGYSDGYISMADNYYIYFEPKSSRYIYIPSDLDMTFGSGFMNLSQVTSGNYSTFPGFYTRPLLNKILQVPEFESQFTDLIFEITAKLFNPEKLEKRIDDQVEMIAEDVAWDKQSHRVSKNIFVDGATIENLKDTLPSNVDVDTANDFATRIGHPVPLEAAIEGPTGHLSMPGLKEYIRIQSENTLKFYESKK